MPHFPKRYELGIPELFENSDAHFEFFFFFLFSHSFYIYDTGLCQLWSIFFKHQEKNWKFIIQSWDCILDEHCELWLIFEGMARGIFIGNTFLKVRIWECFNKELGCSAICQFWNTTNHFTWRAKINSPLFYYLSSTHIVCLYMGQWLIYIFRHVIFGNNWNTILYVSVSYNINKRVTRDWF